MEIFLQGLQTNSSVLIAIVILSFMIIKQRHKADLQIHKLHVKMDAGFAYIRDELKSINKHLKTHDRDIKRLRKQTRKLSAYKKSI